MADWTLITKYGYDVVAVIAGICIIGSVLVWMFVEGQTLRIALTVVLSGLLLFTLNFFRDPERVTPSGENLVVSPADGRVVLIKNFHDDEFIKEEAVQVSIFMSPLNVHVNRYPISGTVKYFRYFPGEFLVAFDEKSSLRNERTHIGVENAKVRVLFKQIAGFIARRIVADVQEGSTVSAGDRFGMIRFGSRVDIILPRTAELKVQLGDATMAGSTVIAVVS